MNVVERIEAFEKLGAHLNQLQEAEFQSIALKARLENPWFTEDNVRSALQGIARFLKPEVIKTWTSRYNLPRHSKKIALVLAGNIPLVGFHDLLSVLLAGHQAMIKLSSKDSALTRYILDALVSIAPDFRNAIHYAEQLKSFDAVIATGSDNSARYFDYYFGKYPHIIRKNRTSLAILTGDEPREALHSLGNDVFSYFGLGCRNVSKLFVPAGYELPKVLDAWEPYQPIIHHHKYCNNYDYQKSIMLINRVPFLDNGFVMLHESSKMVSPISVVFYEVYENQEALQARIKADANKIQCIVGKVQPAEVEFGKSQSPEVWDYADKVDTMAFLCAL